MILGTLGAITHMHPLPDEARPDEAHSDETSLPTTIPAGELRWQGDSSCGDVLHHIRCGTMDKVGHLQQSQLSLQSIQKIMSIL